MAADFYLSQTCTLHSVTLSRYVTVNSHGNGCGHRVWTHKILHPLGSQSLQIRLFLESSVIMERAGFA